MSVIILPIIEPVQIANVATLYFTATLRTTIDKLNVSNPDAATPYSVTLYWVPAGGAPTSANIIQPVRALQPLESWDAWPLIGQTLGVGDMIYALASTAAKLNLSASGRTYSP